MNVKTQKMMLTFVLMAGLFHLRAWGMPSSFFMDIVQYRYDERAVFVEILYQAPPSTMKLHVETGDSLWTEQSWENSTPSEGQTPSTQANLGRAFFVAPEGEYQIRLQSRTEDDPNSGGILETNLSIHPFTEDNVSLSGIALASHIRFASASEDQHPFYKNSLFVIPNPGLHFDAKQPIFFYVEVYHLLQGLKSSMYSFEAAVFDSSGQPAAVNPLVKQKKKMHDSVVEYGNLKLTALPSGHYELRIMLRDSSGTAVASTEKRFYCEGAVSKPQAQIDFAQSIFAGLDGSALKQEYEEAYYLMNETERTVFKAMKDDDAMKRALFAFWRNWDPSPDTPENEFYFEYKKRIQYANDYFTAGFRDGWKTDRGRVYCVYGKPSDIERHPSSGEIIPYENWSYESLEGGVEFIFADFTGMNQYVLIHSTKQGEVYNPNYMNMVERGF